MAAGFRDFLRMLLGWWSSPPGTATVCGTFSAADRVGGTFAAADRVGGTFGAEDC